MDSNNSLQFYNNQYFHHALMGCVVTTDNCLNATYLMIPIGMLYTMSVISLIIIVNFRYP